MTSVEVEMELTQHLQEREYIEGHQIRVNYPKMPKTCHSCKQPGSECPAKGGQGYACRIQKPEASWSEVYEQVEQEKVDKSEEIEERINSVENFTFEEK